MGADIGVLNARPLTVITNSGVVPYFRTGLQYASILCLASIEPASVNVTVSLMDNSGVSLGSRQLTLAGMGGIRAPIQNLFASLGNGEHEGWILIQSSGRVNANILFGRSDAGAFSAVPMQALPMANIVFPFAFNGFGASMELSLVNAGASPSGIGINVVQPSGVTLAAGQITLPPGSRISQNLHQLFPEIQNLPGGYIYLSASQPVFSTASLWSDDGTTVSNFIPQPLTTSFSVPALKSFAVTGKVTLNDTPTPGFPVVLSGPVSTTAVSDADGLYAFTGLPPGDYSVGIGQAGVEFVFAQVNFQITNASIRQDLQGYTVPNAIVVQPGSLAVSSPDAAVDIYGNNFSTGSQAFANLVRLDTTFVNSTHLKAVIPAYLLATPARLSISVATGDLVSQSFSFAAFQSAPTLTGIVMPNVMPQIFEGSPGATLTLNGTGFLPGLIVIVNGASDGIQVNVVNSTQALASVPASYFKNGGIYPVAVQNSDPSNTQSNVLLLTVYYPSPEVQTISPNQVSVELEPGLGPVPIEIFGFGFKRGAVAQFITDPKKDPVLLATSYCETDAYCLATHLYASIPANLLRQSGDVLIAVLNPSPTLGSSGAQVLEIRGLEPTITGVLPGSAAIRDVPGKFTMPVVINGTNFGPQTQVEVTDPLGNLPQSAVTVLSSTQLVAYIDVTYPDALGLWTVVVLNPGPGGGISSINQFQILQENFVGNPFLFTVNPTDVAAGGPGFTLTITGMNFQSGAQVQFYSTLLTPTLVTGYVITVNVPANLIQTAGKFPISVANPGTGGNSNRLYLNVR